ncbi:putative molybdenum carrier protein [soil metagenome]
MKAKRIKIISGGQTGADRAALDAAFSLGISTGGFCPKNFRTEAGCDPGLKIFGLKPTKSSDYSERTIKNIKLGKGTVIFCSLDKKGKITGKGTMLTLLIIKKHKKLYIINPGPVKLLNWVRVNKIVNLNVAGSRGSQDPRIYLKVRRTMRTFLKMLNE